MLSCVLSFSNHKYMMCWRQYYSNFYLPSHIYNITMKISPTRLRRRNIVFTLSPTNLPPGNWMDGGSKRKWSSGVYTPEKNRRATNKLEKSCPSLKKKIGKVTPAMTRYGLFLTRNNGTGFPFPVLLCMPCCAHSLKIHDRDIEAGCPGQLFSLQWIFNAIGRT